MSDARLTYLNIAAVKRGPTVIVTLTQQNGTTTYTRTYDCTIDDADDVTFPRDLTWKVQTMLIAICFLMKYPNTYEGDALNALSRADDVTLDERRPMINNQPNGTPTPPATGLPHGSLVDSLLPVRLFDTVNGTKAVLDTRVQESGSTP